MKYALAKFRVYLLGDKPFVVYTDHASLRTAIKSPHLSQRMARWLSFFAEFNFSVEYKPGRFNVIADALSRRPDYESMPNAPVSMSARETSESSSITSIDLNEMTVSSPQSPLCELIRQSYKHDELLSLLITHLRDPSMKSLKKLPPTLRSSVRRYSLKDGLLWYRVNDDDDSRIVVPNDASLKLKLMFEYHDAPTAGHRGREKTYLLLSRDFYWPNIYKFVRKYVQACEVCQRAKSYPTSDAPLQPLPTPDECWKSVSMDFIFGFPPDDHGNTGVLVFVCRLSKMVHLAAVPSTISADGSAKVFMENVFRLHGMPSEIVSDRDPRFTAQFWQSIFKRLGTRLAMSTADHPQTDGQTERVNRVLEEVLRAYAHQFHTNWSEHLAMAEFAINNSVHSSTECTPFYVNGLRHPRIPPLIGDDTNPNEHGESINSPNHALDCAQSNDRPLFLQTQKQKLKGSVPKKPNLLEPDMNRGPVKDRVDGGSDPNPKLTGSELNSVEQEDLNTSDRSDHSAQEISSTPGVDEFIDKRKAVIRFVRDSIAKAIDKQKKNADRIGRTNSNIFNVGDYVLLSTKNLPEHAVTCSGSSKLLPKYIGPFQVVKRLGNTYTLNLPSSMRTHPTFYVGRLRPYHQHVADAYGEQKCVGHSTRPTSTCSQQQVPSTDHQVSEPAHVFPSTLDGDPESHDSQEHLLEDHIQQDKQVIDPAQQIYPPPPPPLIDSHGDQRWIVDALIDHCTRSERGRRVRYYRVRWLGYPPSADTWESRSALQRDVPDVVSDYDQAHDLPSRA